MQNADDSKSGIKPQSIIKAPQSGPFQLGAFPWGIGGTVFHRDFQADLLASRNIEKNKWLRADNNPHFCELVRGAVRLHRRGTDPRP